MPLTHISSYVSKAGDQEREVAGCPFPNSLSNLEGEESMRSLTALCLALSPLPDTLPLVLEEGKKVLSVVCIQGRVIWSS